MQLTKKCYPSGQNTMDLAAGMLKRRMLRIRLYIAHTHRSIHSFTLTPKSHSALHQGEFIIRKAFLWLLSLLILLISSPFEFFFFPKQTNSSILWNWKIFKRFYTQLKQYRLQPSSAATRTENNHFVYI